MDTPPFFPLTLLFGRLSILSPSLSLIIYISLLPWAAASVLIFSPHLGGHMHLPLSFPFALLSLVSLCCLRLLLLLLRPILFLSLCI